MGLAIKVVQTAGAKSLGWFQDKSSKPTLVELLDNTARYAKRTKKELAKELKDDGK